MTPATWPRADRQATRLLYIDPSTGTFDDRAIMSLPELLDAGDVVVVNDAATLPASLHGMTESGDAIELRLAGSLGEDACWRAVVFGSGDWRTRTEDRPLPPQLHLGETLQLAGLTATVVAVDASSPRLVEVRFDLEGDAFFAALYRAGRPVQYAYLDAPIALWQVQTAYAGRPWAVEPPSAGLALTWSLLRALEERGVILARVTHAAGLSSTGDTALDARFPLPERYAIPDETVRVLATARASGHRILALGTTVTRALEGAAEAGALQAGEGITSLRLGPHSALRIVDGIFTGMHDPESSHFELLESFAPRALLTRAHALATERGYRDHEFGDTLLVWKTTRG